MADTYQDTFKEGVINELVKMGIKKTTDDSQLTGAARPSNIDEDGNIIDTTKKDKVEVVSSDSKPSSENYERGLVDAYNTIRKIVRVNHVDGYTTDELDRIFGESDPVSIINEFNIYQIMRNVHEYELEVIENITFDKGDEFLVTEDGYEDDEYDRLVTLCTEDNMVIGFNSTGKIRKVPKTNCKHTGRSFGDLLEICKKMDEEDQ